MSVTEAFVLPLESTILRIDPDPKTVAVHKASELPDEFLSRTLVQVQQFLDDHRFPCEKCGALIHGSSVDGWVARDPESVRRAADPLAVAQVSLLCPQCGSTQTLEFHALIVQVNRHLN